MHVMDLGRLEDAVLGFSGPYLTFRATRAVLDEAAGVMPRDDAGVLSGYWPSEEVLSPVSRRADLAKG